ncbi:MAG: hypothetical protein GQ574_12360 [Crocinitomix sp.]|nr:hypothetical protein [Crocinitomix sp.]
MTKQFLKTAQVFVLLNLLIQLVWIIRINFPQIIPFYLVPIELELITVVIVNSASMIFIGIYLFKKGFKLALYSSILEGVYYACLLAYWYSLILFKTNLDDYITAYYGLLCVSLFYGLILVFSHARTNVWLKWTGIILIAVSVVNLAFEFLAVSNDRSFLNIVKQISDFVGLFTFILMLLNFKKEIKLLPVENDALVDSP